MQWYFDYLGPQKINSIKKMWKSSIVLLLFCSCLGIQQSLAQDGIFGATLLAGFNASQIDGDDYPGFNKLGFNVGIRGDIYIADKMQVGMELTYSQRGSRSELLAGQSALPQLIIDLDYIQVPVLFRFSDWYIEEENYFRVNAFAGLSYGRLLRSRAINSYFEGQTELFNKNDIGFHIGAGYQFNPNMAITLRFNRGLTKVFDHRDDPLVARSHLSRYLTFRVEYSL